MEVAQPPHVDEHETTIAADVDEVWRSLLESLDRDLAGRALTRYAGLVGCEPRAAAGPRPLATGSTIPGFRVAAAVPGRELVLEGRHRFSTYALVFRLEPASSGHTRLRAETRAAFPGVHGRVYRLLVVGTRAHVIAVRRVLASVRRRSERHVASDGAR